MHLAAINVSVYVRGYGPPVATVAREAFPEAGMTIHKTKWTLTKIADTKDGCRITFKDIPPPVLDGHIVIFVDLLTVRGLVKCLAMSKMISAKVFPNASG